MILIGLIILWWKKIYCPVLFLRSLKRNHNNIEVICIILLLIRKLNISKIKSNKKSQSTRLYLLFSRIHAVNHFCKINLTTQSLNHDQLMELRTCIWVWQWFFLSILLRGKLEYLKKLLCPGGYWRFWFVKWQSRVKQGTSKNHNKALTCGY